MIKTYGKEIVPFSSNRVFITITTLTPANSSEQL